jgi:S1-C subfamily serine protease
MTPRTRWLAGLLTAAMLFLAEATAGAQELKYALGILGRYTPDGMLVQRVSPGSPMDRAGVQPDDVILKMDGQLIQSQDDLAAVVNSSGGSVVLVVARAGGKGPIVRIAADLTGRGKGPAAPYVLGVIGKFTPDGLLVRTLVPGTPAAATGLQKGDLIVKINGQFIPSQEALSAVLNASGGTANLVVRSGQNGRISTVTTELTTLQLGVLGDFTRDGMVVGTVAPGTPAERVGLQRGDLIVRIDNQPVRDQAAFKAALNNSGGSVVLTVRRGLAGPAVRVPVDLMNNPLGAWCEPAQEGMRITAVGPDSPAALIGLQRGDVILKIDDQRVRSQSELSAALYNSGGFITLTVRQGQTGRVVKVDADLAR